MLKRKIIKTKQPDEAGKEITLYRLGKFTFKILPSVRWYRLEYKNMCVWQRIFGSNKK